MQVETTPKVKKVLVVEDERPLNEVLRQALTRAGFETAAAYDGESALNMLLKSKYDLVLLDILLPKISGIDVLAEMSKRRDLTPVIVVTNLGREESKKEVMGLGAKEYLVKSETPIAEIVKLVQNFY